MSKRQSFLLVFVLCLVSANSTAADRRSNQNQLSIMTFNGEFLWDGVPPEEGQVEFDWKNDPTAAAAHMEDIATVIRQHDPDIINMVEVESLAALENFINNHLANSGYIAYLVKGADSFTGQDVGLITRIDPVNNQVERFSKKGKSGSVEKSVSKNYFAKFEISGNKFSLVGIHFLSRPTDTSRKLKRQAQADAINDLARELDSAGYPPIVLGDFNDFDNGDSLDHNDNLPITNVLARIKWMVRSDPSDDLENAAARIPKSQRFTAFWDRNRNGQIEPPGEFSMIDHILVPPEMAEFMTVVSIPRTHDPRLVSDHYPVIANFDFSGETAVRIERLIPNPVGKDSQLETVTLLSDSDISIDGWKLCDAGNKCWTLTGDLVADVPRVFVRNGRAMSLNNNGDTINLLDGETIIDTVTYGRVSESDVVSKSL